MLTAYLFPGLPTPRTGLLFLWDFRSNLHDLGAELSAGHRVAYGEDRLVADTDRL